MNELRYQTSSEWLDIVLADFDSFLQDHAGAEKKASGMAISMISHYPDRMLLVEKLAELAIEELNHYREVIKILHRRNLQLGADRRDPYVIEFRKAIREGKDNYFLDRLLVAGIIEARGAERFELIAHGLPDGRLKNFYQSITNSEMHHRDLFKQLAENYFDIDRVNQRHCELLDVEAEIVRKLPLRPALH